MFNPKVLNPEPDPNFVRELRRIDPDLRVEWGYGRYLKNDWVIERKIPAERYFAMYSSVLSGEGPRFVEQPIFDTNLPELDDQGDIVSYKQVGTRTYDLAPRYEWVTFADALDGRVLLDLRRTYAWERNHTLSRATFEKEQREAEEKKQKDAKDKRMAAGMEGVDEAFYESRAKVQFGFGATRNET